MMIKRGLIECLGCGEHKPVTDYSPVNALGAPRPYCKPCNAARVRLSNYNVTMEFIDQLRRFQQDICAVCGTTHTDLRAMDIDHDHACCSGGRSCGECARGLICKDCNAHGLGWYEGLPPELRTFDLLNAYLADPPAKRLRCELAASAGG
ncbi:endonuclease domain-containing protein [Streptomyces sp. NBC_00457]|uniref:endonuclease domain-containing protein n=1 Tax=Streptomyces sp. NBC_00457 TaxID=2975748 RepID=UPI003FCE23E5